ncbi:hypothetical protein ABAC460_00320 [Asticcacaulis sp. AC460]|uniref:hypothetical protein n=1 Tax=Asticcacaulis sp. AC460 TaxID=1282360 RepID=UPI0003C3FF03|nr:hypothetical protein [Asticcacaulis sp. AC460]ESQ93546.1 hypothetical protein ABAC460_00320 [Asticcacaulis sp. AC460]
MKIRKLYAITAVALIAAVSVSGCATKRYGRMQSLVPAEAEALDCKQIGIEIAKVEGFELQVAQGSEIDWKSVAGFLGDYGIGNTIEKNSALKSAAERKAQLRDLQTKKNCPVT